MSVALLKTRFYGKTKRITKNIRKAKITLWPFLVLVVILLMLLVSTNDYYKHKIETIREETGKLHQDILRLEQTQKERDDFYKKRDLEINEKLQSRAEAKAKLASVQLTRYEPVQRLYADRPDIEAYIRQVFGDAADQAIEIANCESGFNVMAVGSVGERGVFQIHPVHISSLIKQGFTWDGMFNYQENVRYAKMLYDWQGQRWTDWTCAKRVGLV